MKKMMFALLGLMIFSISARTSFAQGTLPTYEGSEAWPLRYSPMFAVGGGDGGYIDNTNMDVLDGYQSNVLVIAKDTFVSGQPTDRHGNKFDIVMSWLGPFGDEVSLSCNNNWQARHKSYPAAMTIMDNGVSTVKCSSQQKTVQTGWMMYRIRPDENGAPSLSVKNNIVLRKGGEVVGQATLDAVEASRNWTFFANKTTGLSLANPSGLTIKVNLVLRDGGGSVVYSTSATLGPWMQVSKFVLDFIPQLSSRFEGRVELSSADPFLAAGLLTSTASTGLFTFSTLSAQ